MTVDEGRRRVVIEGITPQVDGGRFPARRIAGDLVEVTADIFADGHDELAAVLHFRSEADPEWSSVPMELMQNDRWSGSFPAERLGRYRFTLEAWVDTFATWQRDLEKRVTAAGQDLSVQFRIGARLLETAARNAGNASNGDIDRLLAAATLLAGPSSPAAQLAEALSPALLELMHRQGGRPLATRFSMELSLVVDPPKARFSSWYEMFPRSASSQRRHGTFDDVAARLPYVASMGFDVLYLPPIHPIGRSYRKGPNNALAAGPDDPGSPWAIGGVEGGHDSIHPELGDEASLGRLIEKARLLGIDIALDIAFQASPDHPIVRQHPDWFRRLPDGSIQYAENPPKKYQDIYPFNFETDDWQGLWHYLLGIFLHWRERGVTIFRVDNPHTKPFAFWEWCIAAVKEKYPDTIFLAEAFTAPKVMYYLAKLGFTQSYTYFAWKNAGWELTAYFKELTSSEVREFFRGNLWPNTPDILTGYLQQGERPAFIIRLILAATLGASYGIYGPPFELMEHEPRESGSEEYLDSEKYQFRHWDLERADSLRFLIARLNQIRREHRALQGDWSLRFHPTSDEEIICYSKSDGSGDLLIMAVNLDPLRARAAVVRLDLEELGLDDGPPFEVHDQLTDARYIWRGSTNYVELNPASLPAHLFVVRKLQG